MGYFGSKATAGLCQPLIAMMPPHGTYIEEHLTIFCSYDNETWRGQMDAAVASISVEMSAAGTPDGTVQKCILLAIEDIFSRKDAGGCPRFFEVLEKPAGPTVKD